MNVEQSKAFLQAIGAKASTIKADGKWLRCSCPLARWTHQNHKDSNPSFALSLDETKRAFFHCFTCESGDASELLQAIELYTRDDPELAHLYNFKRAHELLDDQELLLPDMPDYNPDAPAQDKKPFIAWPEAYLQSFINAQKVTVACEYLFRSKEHINGFGQKCRDAVPLAVDYFDLRYDDSKGMIVFPYRDVNGRLAGMRGRSIVEHKHHDYTWYNGDEKVNNASLVWYNEEAFNLPGWVVVCEGQMDVLRVWSGGYTKVIGNLTGKPVASKLDKLLWAEGTILIPDNDKTGAKSVELFRNFHLSKNHPFRVLNLPDSIKDADDAHPQYLADRIQELLNSI